MTWGESKNASPLGGDTTFELSEEIMSQHLEGETVLLDLASEKYFSLDAVGTRIWELTGEGVSLNGIIETLQREFDVEPGTAQKDVRVFLQSLLDAGLIRTRVARP